MVGGAQGDAGDNCALQEEVESLRMRVRELEDAQAARLTAFSPLLDAILELPLLFFRVDADGRFSEVLGSAVERLGIRSQDLIGRNVYETFPESTQSDVRKLRGNLVWTERSGMFEGRPWSAITYTTRGDDRAGFVGVSLDVTEWKQVQNELAASEQRYRSLADELNQRVEERTDQLVHANKELEAFCYSVSHDLRAPLRGIDGYCRILGEDFRDGFSEKGRGYLERVRAASQRMGRLIDDLLRLSRASLGEIAREPVDLTALAASVAEDLQRQAPERKVRFRIAEGLTAQGDPRLLRDVLENLLGNAFKFSARTAEPCIELRTATAGDGRTAFCVEDNGAGFDMAQSGRLFRAFSRLDHEEAFEGTGVGLATVDRIVRRHGGEVWAQGKVGNGAAFFFTLGRD